MVCDSDGLNTESMRVVRCVKGQVEVVADRESRGASAGRWGVGQIPCLELGLISGGTQISKGPAQAFFHQNGRSADLMRIPIGCGNVVLHLIIHHETTVPLPPLPSFAHCFSLTSVTKSPRVSRPHQQMICDGHTARCSCFNHTLCTL